MTRNQLLPVEAALVGFGGHVVHPEGMIRLTVTSGRHPQCQTIPSKFVVIKADSPYNLIVRRPTLNALRVMYSTYHLIFKYPMPAGIAEVSSDVCAARECYLATLQVVSSSTIGPKTEGTRSNILSIDCIDPRHSRKPQRLEAGDEIEEVPLDPLTADQTIRIGTNLFEPLGG